MLPRRVQISLRRLVARWKQSRYRHSWPIDESAANPPKNWRGWPGDKKFALILTHDVELAGGQEKCLPLMELEKRYGFRSSFNFVPERYPVSKEVQQILRSNNFEIGVHGLYHDGKLYQSEKIFRQRAEKINRYLADWQAAGFRSPSMHHNLAWLHHLNIKYDLSTFDTDPFEPQSDGVATIFPFRVQNGLPEKNYVELPYTLVQDYTHFIMLKKTDIKIWQEKLDWIVAKGGMALLNTHPDYMNFNGNQFKPDEYTAAYYEEFLKYVHTKYKDQYWNVIPKVLAAFWQSRF